MVQIVPIEKRGNIPYVCETTDRSRPKVTSHHSVVATITNAVFEPCPKLRVNFIFREMPLDGAKRPADHRELRQQTCGLPAVIRNTKEADNALRLLARLPCKVHRFLRPTDEGNVHLRELPERLKQQCRSLGATVHFQGPGKI